MHWVGIDVGGTFTDGVAYDEKTGAFAFAKASSTPDDPTRGVIDVLAALKLDIASIERFVHGQATGPGPLFAEYAEREDVQEIGVFAQPPEQVFE